MAIIAAGEGQTTEFKETTGASKEATKTLAAFASQSVGGVVIFGVDDCGALFPGFSIGSNTQERLAGTIKANTISMTTAQPLIPAIHAFKDPDLLVVEVPPGTDSSGPYLAFGARWRRAGATTNRIQTDYRQLAKAYQQHLIDPDEMENGHPLPFRFCPQCGSERLDFGSQTDWEHDEVYYVVRCTDCAWGDWSQ